VPLRLFRFCHSAQQAGVRTPGPHSANTSVCRISSAFAGTGAGTALVERECHRRAVRFKGSSSRFEDLDHFQSLTAAR
jgi:hypothetical protein